MKKEKQRWPAWCLGPNGESVLVKLADELPKGFRHPRLKPSAPVAEPAGLTGAGDLSTERTVDVDLDAGGWPWTEGLHASGKTKTQAGFWRMKIGQSRPEPKPGYPLLDL